MVRYLYYVIASQLLFNNVAIADDGDSSNNSFFTLPVVAAIICYFRRKEPIGGWLLFYFFTVFNGAFQSIPTVIYGFSGGWFPSSFDSTKDYLIFIFTAIPTNICILIEIVLCVLLMVQSTRSLKYVKLLKVVLLIDLVVSAISLPIEITGNNNSEALVSFMHLLLSSIWFLYFKKSLRVKMIFDGNSWDYGKFISVKNTINQPIATSCED